MKTFADHLQCLHMLGGHFVFLFRSRDCKNESRANCINYWKRNQSIWRDLIYAILRKTWDFFTKQEAKGWADAEALYTLYLSLVQRLKFYRISGSLPLLITKGSFPLANVSCELFERNKFMVFLVSAKFCQESTVGFMFSTLLHFFWKKYILAYQYPTYFYTKISQVEN